MCPQSHGVKRTRQSKEVIEARKLKEQEKLKEYIALSDDILSRVRPSLVGRACIQPSIWAVEAGRRLV
jgi:hypothetical protein